MVNMSRIRGTLPDGQTAAEAITQFIHKEFSKQCTYKDGGYEWYHLPFDRMAARTGFSTAYIRSILNKMQEDGLVVKEFVPRFAGRSYPLYRKV
jgi:hypothetical protein